jgi:branched-subunit amino acid aminotransferase/4-amino-4-deoxychorismate lyase
MNPPYRDKKRIECIDWSARFTNPLVNLDHGNPEMTCYLRHLEQMLKKSGIEVTSENRQEIDRIIHDIVGVNYKNCPAAWRQVKSRVSEDEAAFVSMVKEALNKRK